MPTSKKYFNILICFLSASSGFLIILYSTAQGIGISPDSTIYVSVGRNIINEGCFCYFSGDGNLIAMSEFPPLYPLLLAVPGIMGIDAIAAVRFSHACLFALNISLFYYIIYGSTRSIFFSILGALLFLGSKSMILVHSMAWSEPFFLFFVLLNILLLSKHLARRNNLFLYGSAMMVSAAILTRYAGLPLIATSIAAIMLLSNAELKGKLKHCLIFTSFSLLPLIFWMIRNIEVAGSVTNRDIELIYHPIAWKKLLNAAYNLSISFIPFEISIPKIHTIIDLILVLIFLFCAYYWLKTPSRKFQTHNRETSLICIFFILFYVIFLLISISFYAADTPLDERILAPSLILFVLLILITGQSLSLYLNRKKFNLVITAVLTCWVIISINNSLTYASIYHNTGLEYTSKQWKNAAIINELMKWPPGEKIFSNHPGAVYILTGRLCHGIPAIYNVHTLKQNSSLIDELASMKQQMERQEAILVWIDLHNWPSQPTIHQLKNYLPLVVVRNTVDGSIYTVKKR